MERKWQGRKWTEKGAQIVKCHIALGKQTPPPPRPDTRSLFAFLIIRDASEREQE